MDLLLWELTWTFVVQLRYNVTRNTPLGFEPWFSLGNFGGVVVKQGG
jgi:hypothetical protein